MIISKIKLLANYMLTICHQFTHANMYTITNHHHKCEQITIISDVPPPYVSNLQTTQLLA